MSVRVGPQLTAFFTGVPNLPSLAEVQFLQREGDWRPLELLDHANYAENAQLLDLFAEDSLAQSRRAPTRCAHHCAKLFMRLT
jgi:hypothetical protein